jgi:hypothetical protein
MEMTTTIRVMYQEEPKFPATDQHPDAERYEIEVDGKVWFVDAVGGAPTVDDVRAALFPPVEPPTADPVEKLVQFLVENPDVEAMVAARK